MNQTYLLFKNNHALLLVSTNGRSFIIDWTIRGTRKRELTKPISRKYKIANITNLAGPEKILSNYEKSWQVSNCSQFVSCLIYGHSFTENSTYLALLFKEELRISNWDYAKIFIRSVFMNFTYPVIKKVKYLSFLPNKAQRNY